MKTLRPQNPQYCVLTWDTDLARFTPQQGVRRGPYSLWGLKRALRKLRHLGYSCDYRSRGGGDSSVCVQRLRPRRVRNV